MADYEVIQANGLAACYYSARKHKQMIGNCFIREWGPLKKAKKKEGANDRDRAIWYGKDEEKMQSVA